MTELLADFATDTFCHDDMIHRYHRLGSGPAVVVIAEIPGITPKVIEFARRVAAAGCTVYLPSLFGVDGADSTTHGPSVLLKSLGKVCVSREFTIFATGKSSAVVRWLRGLAAKAHDECGGPGVGAVGMCVTGGFALAMAVDDRMLAPVLSQPSLPLAITPGRRHNIDIGSADLDVVKARCAGGLQVLGARFDGDKLSPPDRFRFLGTATRRGGQLVGAAVQPAQDGHRGPVRGHDVCLNVGVREGRHCVGITRIGVPLGGNVHHPLGEISVIPLDVDQQPLGDVGERRDCHDDLPHFLASPQ